MLNVKTCKNVGFLPLASEGRQELIGPVLYYCQYFKYLSEIFKPTALSDCSAFLTAVSIKAAFSYDIGSTDQLIWVFEKIFPV